LNFGENVVKILKSSCAEGTWKQYESSLKKWGKFCVKNQWNVYESNLSHYLSFLASLFEAGLSYNSINTARSALSSVFPPIDHVKIGEHRLVAQFMRGIARLRPIQSKYSVTWDPSLVLNLLESWDNSRISLKQLTLKLASLLALITSQRVQTLAEIRISNIVHGNPIQIRICTVLKTTGVKNPNPILIVPPYHVKNLCPVSTLRCYLDRTNVVRGDTDSLFISFVSPYKKVSAQTLSRWLCTTLELAHVDTSVFTGHSFRHSSISKAASRGISTDSIFKRVGWSNGSSTFAKFYNKPIDTRSEFAAAILSKSN